MKTISNAVAMLACNESLIHQRMDFIINRNASIRNCRFTPLEPDDANVSIEAISEAYGIQLLELQLKDLLALYPDVRMKVVSFGAQDTETREGLLDMVCNYLLGCSAPVYGNSLSDEDTKRFLTLLRSQAQKMGFQITPD